MAVGGTATVKRVLDAGLLWHAQYILGASRSGTYASRRVFYAPGVCQTEPVGRCVAVAVLVVADVCHILDGRLYAAQLKEHQGEGAYKNPRAVWVRGGF